MERLELVIGNKNYSSWSLRPWIWLRHRDIPFSEIRLAFGSEEWNRRIGSLSPTGLVPALRHGDLTVCDSLAILEYLAELFPDAHGWPKERAARARARAVSAEMHSRFAALRSEFPMDARASTPGRPRSAAAERDIARVRELWTGALSRSGGPFLFGDFSAADAMYAPVVLRFATYGLDPDAAGRRYIEAMQGLPAMREWIEASRREVEHIDLFPEGAKATP